MSLFTPEGLAISLPGAELAKLDLPGSVTEPDAVLSCSVSLELRTAIRVVLDECRRREVPVRIVARPEIFIHGNAERWLRERLGNITQHLCISDGSSIKTIAGCETHVFFYCLARYENLSALRRLSTRAPELVSCVASQINTCLALGTGEQRFVPHAHFITSKTVLPRPASRLMPFFFNTYSAEDTLNRIEQRGAVNVERVPPCSKATYIPLTETALHDPHFARVVAQVILQTFFNPDTMLVLRLPQVDGGLASLSSQIHAIVPSLRDAGVTIPYGFPPNLLLATGDLDEGSFPLKSRPWTLILHESFDFWRHTKGFFWRPERILVISDHAGAGTFLPVDVAPLFGPRASRVLAAQSVS